jgi:hypothetical protein
MSQEENSEQAPTVLEGRYVVGTATIQQRDFFVIWDTEKDTMVGKPYTERHNAERRVNRLNLRS